MDKFQGILRFAVLSYLEVKMGACASSRTPHLAYLLPLPDVFSLLHEYSRQMTISCGIAVTMPYNHQLSVSTHIACVCNAPAHGGSNPGSVSRGEI